MERVKNHSELHNHNSIGSLLDGMGMPNEIMPRCDELGLKAYAITDHGTEFALYYFAEIQNKYDTKIIYGVELYEAYNHLEQDEHNKYFHLLALAKTQKGIQALHQLTTKGEFEGKYYKPRVDLNQLKEFKDDLIIGSACLAGKINRAKTYDEAKQYALEYKEIFGDNFYLELQAHSSESQMKANEQLMKLHYELDIPYIITSDSHYVSKVDSINHSKFINVNRKNADTTIANEIYENCYLHSTNEMYEIMLNGGLTEDEITIGLQNTNIIADLCKGKIEFNEPQLPKVEIPKPYKSQEEYFMALILQGWEDRHIEKQAEEDENHTLQDYKERLLHEFNVIKQMDYIDYHLIVGDYMQYAVNNKIPTAPGRGSGAGSLINYLLKITNINPLKYNLIFERYLNIERVSLPDIDSDFSSGRRDEVFKYLQNKYGADYVAQIINISKYTPKVAIADASKMCIPPVPMKDVNAIKEFMVDDTIDECIKNSKNNVKLQELINLYPEMFELAKSFEGRIKTTGTNACFLEDELIMTNKGYKKIKDIIIGDKVLTHMNAFKPVINTIINESNDIYELKIGNTLPIKVTGNHPFLIRNKIIENKERKYSNAEWKSVIELDKNSMMGIAINQNSIIPKNDIDLPYDNEDFWWIIGRYIGDGWCEYAQKSHRRSFIICCDKTNKNELNEIIKHLNGFNYRCEESRTTYKIYIKSRKLYDYVQQFGKYAYGKRLTNDIFDLPIHLLKEFLNGYLSADGHYDKKENVQVFKTVSKELALGMSACINKIYHKHCGISVLNPKIEYIEGRKVYSKEKYQCRFSKDKRIKDHAFYEDGYIWTPFKELNKLQHKDKVYNLTVEDDNSYTVNNIIVHNCGTVISSKPIYEYCGMKKGENGEQLLQVDKVITEKLGMVKCDVLGTTVLQIIDEVLHTQGMDFYEFMDNLSYEDKDTYDFLEKGLYYGVFQLGSYNMTKFFMKLKPKNLEDICLGISAYRPGSMKYIDKMINRKNGIEPIQYDHPLLENVLKNTYGIPVYQEQVMEMLQVLAGFTYAQADLVRRGMSKKKAEYVLGRKQAFIYGEVKLHEDVPTPKGGNGNKYEKDERIISYERAKKEYNEEDYDLLIEGCIHKNIDEQLAIKIYTDLEDFALYGFNKSHGLAYAILTYITAYLKCRYPIEFMNTILTYANDTTEMTKYLVQCRDMNIKILNPNINQSDLGFKICENGILYGIGSLYNVGEPTVKQLIKNRPYTSFQNFLDKNVFNIKENEIKFDKSSLVSLINSGCFDILPMYDNETEKSTREVLLVKIFSNNIKQISKVSATNIPELFDNNIISDKDFPLEYEIYKLHKNITSKNYIFDIVQDDEIITKIKNIYTDDIYSIEGNSFILDNKKYKKQYDKKLENIKDNMKQNLEEYSKKINKIRILSAYFDYRNNRDDADLEFESTSFYFQKSWLDTSQKIYSVDEFKDIPSLDMEEVGYYSKKQLYVIVGTLTGKIKKHKEIILLTNSGIVIAKLGDILYNTIASDLNKGDKIALNGYVGDGFFRAEYYINGKSNKVKALKVI